MPSSADEVDSCEKSDSDFSVADGLKFSDDDEVLNLHLDSDDEMCSSFPKDSHQKMLILGGPQAPDRTGLSDEEYKKLYNVFRQEQKRYTDKK